MQQLEKNLAPYLDELDAPVVNLLGSRRSGSAAQTEDCLSAVRPRTTRHLAAIDCKKFAHCDRQRQVSSDSPRIVSDRVCEAYNRFSMRGCPEKCDQQPSTSLAYRPALIEARLEARRTKSVEPA